MPLRNVFPRDAVSVRVGEDTNMAEFYMAQLDEICELKRQIMVEIGAAIGYRAKVLNPDIDLDQFADAFDDSDPRLFEYLAEEIGEPTLDDIYYSRIELADETAEYRTVAELLVAVVYPHVLHIGDVEFSNPRQPIPEAERTRQGTHYKGLGLLGTLVDNCVNYSNDLGLDSIRLTAAAYDLVPLFEQLGFSQDDNELAELMREAGCPAR